MGSVFKHRDMQGLPISNQKGVRQGDPLPPLLLFNIVVDMLAIIIIRAKDVGQIQGLDHDIEQAKNLKLILCAFQQLSVSFSVWVKQNMLKRLIPNLFSCKLGSLPFRYLGIPMHFRKLGNKDWKAIEDRSTESIKKGSIGNIIDTTRNTGLLDGRYIVNQKIKYNTLSQVEKKSRDSQFWSGLMVVKNQFLNLGSFILQNGTQITFWEDIWLGNETLNHQYPYLFNIVQKKHATLAEVLTSSPLNISFRRDLVGDKLTDWHIPVIRILNNVMIQKGNNVFKWDLHKNATFLLNSCVIFLKE
ncbi:hypothetical protein U9M48_001017 [Paspalum notatum var. saurae]|uniref:Reverse transcriptase domain-containing protein n=1 Tax=Paspalum notatum var. saurae TaxID=547442 RepID=A0AAQ3SHT8_PASNO